MKTLLYAGTTENFEIPNGKNAQMQSISREVDLTDRAWLAAAIEGEGHILIVQNYKRYGSKGYTDARIGITNGDIHFIKKVSEILYALNVCFWYQLRKGKKSNHQARLDISTNGLKSCKKVIDCIYPYLVSKKDQADVLIEFIDWRLTSGYGKDFIAEIAEEYKNNLSWLKHNHSDPSQTTRRASYPLMWKDGDIVGA